MTMMTKMKRLGSCHPEEEDQVEGKGSLCSQASEEASQDLSDSRR
jgi:hypothetical protein